VDLSLQSDRPGRVVARIFSREAREERRREEKAKERDERTGGEEEEWKEGASGSRYVSVRVYVGMYGCRWVSDCMSECVSE